MVRLPVGVQETTFLLVVVVSSPSCSTSRCMSSC